MISLFEKHNRISWIITILIAIFIFYLSSLTFEIGTSTGFGWKTIVYHFYAFFILCFFLLMSLTSGEYQKKNLVFWSILSVVIYGICDEIHQIFVPSRAFTIFDILTDSAGALFAGYLYTLNLHGLQKQIKKKTIPKKNLKTSSSKIENG